MGNLILGYGLEFLIQTAFLFAALWIMIKLQTLNFNYPGLILTSVVSTIVSMASDHWLGDYISTGMVCGVLTFCVWKLTRADQIDVTFTVVVGTAMVFAMNLFLVGWLLGDLSPSALGDDEEDFAEDVEEVQEPEVQPAAARTNVMPVQLSESVAKIGKELSLKGVVENGENSSAIIHTGIKNYTVTLNEAASMQTAAGPVTVRCVAIEPREVILEINGERLSLKR